MLRRAQDAPLRIAVFLVFLVQLVVPVRLLGFSTELVLWLGAQDRALAHGAELADEEHLFVIKRLRLLLSKIFEALARFLLGRWASCVRHDVLS